MDPYIEPVRGGSRINELHQRTFKSPLNRGYVRVLSPEKKNITGVLKGCFITDCFRDIEKRIRDMEVRDDDVWVTAFPKSGTTWTQEMVWCIKNDLNFESAKSVPLATRFPMLEFSAFTIAGENISDEMKHSVDYVENMKSPRFIKSHLPWELLPRQLKEKKPKIIYIARNPKDTCISFYYHALRRSLFTGTFEEYVDLFLEDSVNFMPYWDHLLTFWRHSKENSNILFIRYEDMKKDLTAIIHKVTLFLSKKPLPDENLLSLSSHLSFESMQSNDSVNQKQRYGKNLDEENFNFIRKGIVGSWKEEMSFGISQRFDDWIDKHLQGTDFSFSF